MPFIKLKSTLIEKRSKLQEAGVNHKFQAFMQLMRSERGRGHVTRSTGLFRPGIKGLIKHLQTLQHHVFPSRDKNNSQQKNTFQMRSVLQIKTPA